MKKILITVLSLVAFSSCMTDERYEDYNRDPKNPTQVSADYLFNSALKSLSDQMTSTNVNNNVFRLLAQYWTETQYIDEANYDFNGRNITERHWSEIYRDVLLDLKTSQINVTADVELTEDEKRARIAQTEVLSIYAWQQLVDTFGDIPYSQSLDPENFLLPEYDDAATIYTDLFSRLDAAIADLNGSGFEIDNLYFGDMMAWSKFANSLKLRMAMRVVDVPELASLAKTSAEAAVGAGVYTSNSDNAYITYATSTPNTNPLWVDLVQSNRNDFIGANTFIDILNGLKDPRRAVYFDQNLGSGVYDGGIYGANNGYANYSQINLALKQPDFRGVLLDFAEVSFLLADASERSFTVGGTATEHYNNGITASFNDWGATGLDAYLADPKVAYATAAGTWKEKIGRQFWIAMYNRGFEGWTVWRTYDAPTLNIPTDSGLPVPTRYTYPVNEQNLNEDNWTAASTAIGGDDQTTKLFWDVN